MNLFTSIFQKKDLEIKSYDDFWRWFRDNEKPFFEAVKRGKNIEQRFFNKLSPKLDQLKEGIFYLTGMSDENTVELILTPDGNIANIVFVEELVQSAPNIAGWKFIALKPALDINDVDIEMNGYKFNTKNLSFYSNEYTEYPDEIDLSIVHTDFNEDNKDAITSGTFIFLDNYLGELEFATSIDVVKVIGKKDAKKELIPIDKLKAFLTWRTKEFIEKYEGERHNTDNDEYSVLEATTDNGNALIAIINQELLNWNSKASHPWILDVEIKYDGKKNKGMPDQETYELLNNIEDQITAELRDSDGYLNIGRETSEGIRNIYFACKDFRKPSKVLYTLQVSLKSTIELNYNIYIDKYWRSFERFASN